MTDKLTKTEQDENWTDKNASFTPKKKRNRKLSNKSYQHLLVFYSPTNIIAPSSYILEYFPFKSNWLIFSGVNVQWQNLVDLAKYVDWQWSLPSRRVTLWPLIAHICRSHHQIWIPDQFITCACGTRPTFISKHKYAMLPYLRLKIEAKCVMQWICNHSHTSHITYLFSVPSLLYLDMWPPSEHDHVITLGSVR